MIETHISRKHILRAVINRPEARNAVNFRVMDDLEAIIHQIEQNEEIRVLLLSGAGEKAFVAGGDLREFHTIKDKKRAREMSLRMQTIFNRLEQLPVWNVALVNGDAYGGGIELMLAFDFRIAAPGVKLGFTQGRFNLSPGWGGLTRLVEKVGRAKALKWLASAEIIETGQAHDEGILDEILMPGDIEKQSLAWAERLIQNDRKYISTLKKNAFVNSEQRMATMFREIEDFSELWVSEEHINRVNKFFEEKK